MLSGGVVVPSDGVDEVPEYESSTPRILIETTPKGPFINEDSFPDPARPCHSSMSAMASEGDCLARLSVKRNTNLWRYGSAHREWNKVIRSPTHIGD